MKKNFRLAIIIATFLCILPAHAQFNWGIKGGVNLGSNVLAVLNDDFNSRDYTGFCFGPKAEVRIPAIGIGIEAAAMFSQQGVALTENDVFRQNSFQIPLNLKYTLGLGDMANIFVAVGPEFGFNIGKGEQKLDNIIVTEGNNGGVAAFEFKKSTLSFNLGIGATLLNHVQVGVNYHFPWGTTGEFKMVSVEEVKNDANTADRIEGGDVRVEDISWLNKKAAQGQKFSDNFKAGFWQLSVAYLF